MSTQVSDLYKKHHEVSDNIKSIQESIKDLAEELDKAKAENKGLQSEIILLVKQIASLEKSSLLSLISIYDVISLLFLPKYNLELEPALKSSCLNEKDKSFSKSSRE